jgi:iron complex outermembrane receptor protein
MTTSRTILRASLSVAALALASIAAPGAAFAQQAEAEAQSSNDTLDTIVVTAQRRSESVQDVPIAISAFSADTLSNRGIATPLQMVNYVPNLFGANNTGLGSANAYYIRGLGNTESIASFDPPVGTYIDDIYMSRQNGNNFAFFDIDRIEVLRGPQGTLFGRNTTGGAVNVILKKPGEEIGGYVEGAYGAYDLKMVRGSIDLPLNQAISVKLSGYFQDNDGYVNNTTTGERNNDSDMAGVRGAIQMKITDRLTWNGSATYMRNSGENIINFECDPRNPTNCNGRFATTGMRSNLPDGTANAFPGLNDLLTFFGAAGAPFGTVLPQTIGGRKAGFPLGNEVTTQLYTSNFEWAASDDFTVNIITGFINMKQQFALDFADGRGLPTVDVPNPPVAGLTNGGFSITNDSRHTQVTQEIKLNGKLFDGAVEFVTGFFFIDEKNATDFADTFAGAFLLADRRVDNDANSKAGYFQADFNATDKLKLTAGIRYTDEKKTFQVRDNRSFCQITVGPRCVNTENMFIAFPGGARVDIPTAQRAKIWTPRFAVNYAPNDDTLLFASATKGFKSGGWNARGTSANTNLPFDPETVWSYEAGIKSEFLDNRLRVNLTGFWLDVNALQTGTAFNDPITNAITFITQNFADYENKGVELEVSAVPVRGLNIYANLGYQKDKYKVSDTLASNRYNVTSVRAQQLLCQGQLASGQVPLSTSSSAPGSAPNNAPSCAAGIIDANGNIAQPVRTPDWSIAFGGSYDIPLSGAGIIITPSVNAQYRSALETGTANATIYSNAVTSGAGGGSRTFPTNPFGNGDVVLGSLTQPYWQVSAALQMRTDDGNWLVSLECDNCFDESYFQSSLANYNYLNPPRTWQVRVKRSF